jgi:hypothetical protein
MNRISRFSAIAIITMAFVSCSKTSNDTGIALTIAGSTTSGSLSTAKSLSTATEGFTIDEALLGIKNIEIGTEAEHFSDVVDDKGGAKHETDYSDTYLIDLLTGTSTPEIGFKDFTPGVYNKFEAETAGIIPGNKSISIKGSFTDAQSVEYTFEFSTTSELKFEFESASGFELIEGNVLDLLMQVNIPGIFAGIDFSKATKNESNIIIINDLTNTTLLALIKANIHRMADMGEDHDHDRHFDGPNHH